MPNEENSEPTSAHENNSSLNSESLVTKPDHMLPDHLSQVREPAPTAATFAEQPAAPMGQQPATPRSVNTPGILVLQWLTYAFWGWALIALYWLTGLAVQYFVQTPSDDVYGSSSMDYLGDMLAYSLAAVIVLFLISIVCDVIYSKFEPKHKTGAAMVIMIIHAVIFALCGIGSLIVAVFAVVNLMISTSDTSAAMTTLVTAGIMTLLYGATLVRTLRPQKIKQIVPLFWIVMLISTLIIAGLGIFGPAAYAQRTKNDRAVESGLQSIARAINDYADEQGKLPSSLDDGTLKQSYYIAGDDEVALIMDKGLVTYTPKEEIKQDSDADTDGVSMNDDVIRRREAQKVYHYQLCATYDMEKEGYSYGSYDRSSQQYDTSPDTTSHSAGKVCYDLQTDYVY